MENKKRPVIFTVALGAILFFGLFMMVFALFNADTLLASQAKPAVQTAGLAVYQAPERGFFDW